MSILPAGLGFLGPIIQDDVLVREFRDALMPEQIFRSEALVEKWEANIGETKIWTRASLLAPLVSPLTPGLDPTPQTPMFEQWRCSAYQYGGTLDVHMPSSRTALAPLFSRNMKTLGLQSAQTTSRISRNRLFKAYLAGDTVAAAADAASTALVVASLNGFREVLVNGEPTAISAPNPKVIRIAGVAGTHNVTAATPSTADPDGPGTLTLAVAATWAANARVEATDKSVIVRAGNATTVDGLTSSSHLTLAQIRQAISYLRRNRVPYHSDGMYHMHLDPLMFSHLMGDNEFQRLWEGRGLDSPWSEFALGRILDCLVFLNNECPTVHNSGTLIASRAGGDADAMSSPEHEGEMRNASGVAVLRGIITGGGAIVEEYIDEQAEYLSEGGYTGKVGSFSITNNGLVVVTDRIRMIIRAPLDRMQQIVGVSWSFSGDWAIPSDYLGGQAAGGAPAAFTSARYKRAVVLESGCED